MSSNITSHPYIISMISNLLSKADQARLRRANRARFEVVLPMLYKMVKIGHYRNTLTNTYEMYCKSKSDTRVSLRRPIGEFALSQIETLIYIGTYKTANESYRYSTIDLPRLKTLVLISARRSDNWFFVTALARSKAAPERIVFFGNCNRLGNFEMFIEAAKWPSVRYLSQISSNTDVIGMCYAGLHGCGMLPDIFPNLKSINLYIGDRRWISDCISNHVVDSDAIPICVKSPTSTDEQVITRRRYQSHQNLRYWAKQFDLPWDEAEINRKSERVTMKICEVGEQEEWESLIQ